MDERELAERFETHRTHLRAVAYRMLGSLSEADDAVQESWLRLSRAGADGVDNLGGWLTTTVARICLNMLRTRQTRREIPGGLDASDEAAVPATPVDSGGPEQEALLADSVGPALLIVLDTLAPAERLAFVLHDVFAVPFDEIAPIVGRSPAAARQLASRARRRVQGRVPANDADRARQHKIVDAFLAAARDGDFAGLVTLLDPDVVLRADEAAVRVGATDMVLGATAVAQTFTGRARAARVAYIDGAAGLAWSTGGRPRMVFEFTVVHGKVVEIDLRADPERLESMDLVLADE
jgi:RNA polymerase sigma factor (sigma-70 family)